MTMVRLEGVRRHFRAGRREVRALDGIDLAVSPGEFVVVRGPSGSGKTTLLLLVGGMLRPTAGNVLVDGADLYGLDEEARGRFRARNVGFVFQMFHLVPYLSCLENVLLAADGSRGEIEVRSRELLERFGLGERLRHRPSELSAGERQRTALARALVNGPKVLLADEPTGNLDPRNAEEVVRCLSDYHEGGGTVILVTHGTTADGHADRIVHLEAGRIV
jgi:putative ABC transport system ATP-binding protein